MKTLFHPALTLLLAGALAAACTPGDDTEELTQSAAISDCGGFVLDTKSPLGDPATYCDAEMLHWSYDVETQTLSLANNRVLLNCCGDHSMKMKLDGGVYVVTERDAPEFADARCACMCVYDFTLQVQDIPVGSLPLRLVRNVTDNPEGPQLVYEGTLDLTQGLGQVVIDNTNLEHWCEGAVY
jgi:hypothetical protein